jgi:nucleoside 2-deoxyribosyltransferase
MKTIYLAGPILGQTKGEANDWRHYVAEMLSRASDDQIRGVSPLRCEPLIGERYDFRYDDPRFGTPKAIASKNLFDTKNCDFVLAYLPREMGESVSLGTVVEVGWAHALGKPVIIVSDHPKIVQHPVVQACASWTLGTLEEAVDVLLGVLGGYIPGGKHV